LRPYSPGGRLNALAPEATPQGHNLQVDIVYGSTSVHLLCPKFPPVGRNQSSVISDQWSVISYQLSVISYQLSVISYQLSVL